MGPMRHIPHDKKLDNRYVAMHEVGTLIYYDDGGWKNSKIGRGCIKK